MEQIERIRKLKKSEKEILSDIYTIMFYIAIALFFLAIIFLSNNPIAAIFISVIVAFVYTLALVYLIGLAVAFGTVRARQIILKAEIDDKEKEEQEEEEEIE